VKLPWIPLARLLGLPAECGVWHASFTHRVCGIAPAGEAFPRRQLVRLLGLLAARQPLTCRLHRCIQAGRDLYLYQIVCLHNTCTTDMHCMLIQVKDMTYRVADLGGEFGISKLESDDARRSENSISPSSTSVVVFCRLELPSILSATWSSAPTRCCLAPWSAHRRSCRKLRGLDAAAHNSSEIIQGRYMRCCSFKFHSTTTSRRDCRNRCVGLIGIHTWGELTNLPKRVLKSPHLSSSKALCWGWAEDAAITRSTWCCCEARPINHGHLRTTPSCKTWWM
jgi:hypothetical protein